MPHFSKPFQIQITSQSMFVFPKINYFIYIAGHKIWIRLNQRYIQQAQFDSVSKEELIQNPPLSECCKKSNTDVRLCLSVLFAISHSLSVIIHFVLFFFKVMAVFLHNHFSVIY